MIPFSTFQPKLEQLKHVWMGTTDINGYLLTFWKLIILIKCSKSITNSSSVGIIFQINYCFSRNVVKLFSRIYYPQFQESCFKNGGAAINLLIFCSNTIGVHVKPVTKNRSVYENNLATYTKSLYRNFITSKQLFDIICFHDLNRAELWREYIK